MLRQVLHKILSFTMAVVVLFSTFSFTVNRHYCGKKLVDTALFTSAEKCGMEMEEPIQNKGCAIIKKGCCTEDQLLVDGQDQLKMELPNLTKEQQFILYHFVSAYLISLEGFTMETPNYQGHSPPLPSRPLFILYERYLI